MKVYKKFSKYLCTIDFDIVRALVKFHRFSLFFKSSAPYIVENLRDVGVLVHLFESLRSLIQDVGMLLDLDNAVE